MSYTFRTLAADDLEQAWKLDVEAFNTEGRNRRHFEEMSSPDRFHAAFDERGRLVAMTRVVPFGQFFGGRAVRMGGISSVAVAPEARGRGLGVATCRAALGDMRERGEVISTLFPATTGLYRKLGWELSGAYVIRNVPSAAMRLLPAPPERRIVRAEPQDRARIRACYERVAPSVNGFLERPPSSWYWLEHLFDEHFVYLSQDAAGEVDGYVAYRHLQPGERYTIRVRDWIAESRRALASLFWTLGSASTIAETVQYPSSPEDPVLLLVDDQVERVHGDVRFMTRIVDPEGAVAQRGFAPGLDVEATFVLEDHGEGPAASLAQNQGAWRLTVSKGEGRLERVGDDAPGAPRIRAGGFASLYTGWAQTALLERTGLLTGGRAPDRAALDAAFAGPTAWMGEDF